MNSKSAILSLALLAQLTVAASSDMIATPWKVEHKYWDKTAKTSMTLVVETEKGSDHIVKIALHLPSKTLTVPHCAYEDIQSPLIDTIALEYAAGGGIIIAMDAIPIGNTHPGNIKHVQFLFRLGDYKYIQRIVVEGEKGQETKYGQDACGTRLQL